MDYHAIDIRTENFFTVRDVEIISTITIISYILLKAETYKGFFSSPDHESGEAFRMLFCPSSIIHN